MEKKLTVTEPAYEPPLDKECGIMYVLETKEDVSRFVAAYGIRSTRYCHWFNFAIN